MSEQTSRTVKPLLIAGKPVATPGQTFESVNLATGEVNYLLSKANEAHIDAAVAAAAKPAWRSILPHMRAHTGRHRRLDAGPLGRTRAAADDRERQGLGRMQDASSERRRDLPLLRCRMRNAGRGSHALTRRLSVDVGL